jgi:sec-independent protein translocase protein TatA
MLFRQFGWMELLIVLLIVLLIFGPSKLPQLAKSIGKAIREFRQNLSGEQGEESESSEDEKKED